MNKQDSAKTVFLALSVNFFIGLIKSFVAIFTSSSAMFSEAVHSFVDSFNQFLLWFGIKYFCEIFTFSSSVYPDNLITSILSSNGPGML